MRRTDTSEFIVNLSEEDWQRCHEKRVAAVSAVKSSKEYQAYAKRRRGEPIWGASPGARVAVSGTPEAAPENGLSKYRSCCRARLCGCGESARASTWPLSSPIQRAVSLACAGAEPDPWLGAMRPLRVPLLWLRALPLVRQSGQSGPWRRAADAVAVAWRGRPARALVFQVRSHRVRRGQGGTCAEPEGVEAWLSSCQGRAPSRLVWSPLLERGCPRSGSTGPLLVGVILIADLQVVRTGCQLSSVEFALGPDSRFYDSGSIDGQHKIGRARMRTLVTPALAPTRDVGRTVQAQHRLGIRRALRRKALR